MSYNQATLKNWYIVGYSDSPYAAPELTIPVLVGEVYGHPLHHDGKQIRTSTIVGKIGWGRILTKNTVYKLGRVNNKYSKKFPAARRRLLSSLEFVSNPLVNQKK